MVPVSGQLVSHGTYNGGVPHSQVCQNVTITITTKLVMVMDTFLNEDLTLRGSGGWRESHSPA